MSHKSKTLGFFLIKYANQFPDRLAYIYLDDKLNIISQITYRDLLKQTLQLSAQIKKITSSDEIIPIVFTPRMEFIITLFAIIFSGRKVICLNLPNYIFLEKYSDRIKNIFNLTKPKVALYTKQDQPLFDSFLNSCGDLSEVNWLSIEELLAKSSSDTKPDSDLSSSQEVLLQFTSGTTHSPKGVALTHEQIICNLDSIRKNTKSKNGLKLVSWLPHSHDMGLIGGIFVPYYMGGTSIQIKTQDYLKNPLNWLCAISKFKAEATAAPNFAYEQVVHLNDIPSSLDLSCLKVAFNGSEMIRPDTLERFTEKFKTYNFKSSSLFNCYGMAEATLFVAGQFYQKNKSFLSLDPKALLKNKIKFSKDHIDNIKVTNCGRVTKELQIKISGTKNGVGEILISGDSVIKKYWNNSIDKQKNFKVINVNNKKIKFFKTNDLGFIHKHHLFVLGRKDDVVVVNAEKIYTCDVSQPLCKISESVIENGILFFKDDGIIKLMVEIRVKKKENLALLKNNISAIIFKKYLIQPRVILCKQGTLVRTTSGKLNRKKSIEKYHDLKISELV